MNTWYEASMGNHQGLIISEDTGENIAVFCKVKDQKVSLLEWEQ